MKGPLRISFKHRVRTMGRGEAQQKVIQADAESIDNQLAEIGRLEKRAKCEKPTQALPQLPFPTVKFLMAI